MSSTVASRFFFTSQDRFFFLFTISKERKTYHEIFLINQTKVKKNTTRSLFKVNQTKPKVNNKKNPIHQTTKCSDCTNGQNVKSKSQA